MSKYFLTLGFLLILLSGCRSYQMEYGVVENGVVFYPLCERAKQRITDMQRISFQLPLLFRQASCRNWPDYSYNSRIDSVSVEVPSVIVNESQMSVGGVYSMLFRAGHARTEYYLPPDKFFEDYKEYLSERSHISRLVTASWVDWQGGHCARFYSDSDTGLFLRRVLDYFCWESVSGSNFPIHIGASEKLPPGHAPTNLDREFIEPVLASLQINPVPKQRLALWDSYRADFCKRLKESYDNKTAMRRFRDGLNRQRAILFLRECGYQMPDPIGPGSWGELLRPNGQLIGRADGERKLRKVTHAQFAELEAKLMSLQLKPGERPEIRSSRLSKDGSILVENYRATDPYAGDWYWVPPSYSKQNGIGIRNDPVLGRVIDVHLMDFPTGFRVVGE
ncbi:hypothetical protein [Pseudomonas sp. URMO17WK12:I2]|uniref:hypothetical protein n=1 Tax=Pseudomonas sp. URMO17WK12:I2 TaxID=1261623 RepID=UPI000DB50744|nr:hypothetical protein [Pseudomonas sp. URMO17WK12:I2]PZW49454.1 hypothetical protein F469_00252 [Pseudomonas sp. URMO17WK12:I2]